MTVAEYETSEAAEAERDRLVAAGFLLPHEVEIVRLGLAAYVAENDEQGLQDAIDTVANR